jgi:hypothetical protein
MKFRKRSRPVELSAAVTATASIGIAMQSNFDIKWFLIAVEHLRAAEEARGRALAAEDGSTEMAEAFDDETRATMVVVAAAAFAIDALYQKLDELLDESLRSHAERLSGRIVETFKTALDLGKRTAEWQSSIPDLFKLRRELVHFRGELHPSQPHPSGKSHVSREASVYSVERARWAVDLAYEILTVALASPRTNHAGVVAWAESQPDTPKMLERIRQEGR